MVRPFQAAGNAERTPCGAAPGLFTPVWRETVAVIVNDMGAINLDASEIKKHKLIQEKEEMVELQNGCICCTLRGDLLKTVKRLSDSDEEYDHLVIESTGIAEPLPVAQTFVMDVNGDGQFHDDDQQMFSAGKQAEHAHGEGHAAGEEGDTQLEVMDGEGATSKHDPLSDYARMDTLVTVVDAFNVLGTMSSIETLADRQRLIGDEEADQEKSAQLVAAGMAPNQAPAHQHSKRFEPSGRETQPVVPRR